MNKRLRLRFDTILMVTTAAAWAGVIVALLFAAL